MPTPVQIYQPVYPFPQVYRAPKPVVIYTFGVVPICPPCPEPPPPMLPVTLPNPLSSQLGGTDFGQDFDFFDDLNPQMTLVGGLQNLGQAIKHRLETGRGTLFYAPNYGLDTRAWLEETIDPAFLSTAAVQIQNEVLKDERVNAATVNATFDLASDILTIQINVTTDNGPFVFILAVTSLTVTLLNPTTAQ
jgi:phage baseplate assembly protein W